MHPMSSSPLPRPILKRSPKSHPPHTAVHFPPSPTLTRTYIAHSPSSYDRTPIHVAANTCALPERHGRTYVAGDNSLQRGGNHPHPRMVATSSGSPPKGSRNPTRASPGAPVPALIPDLSSESDESDGFTSPPPEYGLFTSSRPLNIPPRLDALDRLNNELGSPTALSFLPHPPSPSERHQYARPSPREPIAVSKPKRRGTKSRKHQLGDPEAEEYVDEDHLPSSTPSYKSFSTTSLLASCRLDDNDAGCLGGF